MTGNIFCINYHNRIVNIFLGLLLALMLISCSSAANSSPPSVTPTPKPATPTASTIPSGTVLFEADWSKGLEGWQATKGWKVIDGMIESDLSRENSLTIPYKPEVSNYVVEYKLQVVSVPENGGRFQLKADSSAQANGYYANVLNLLSPKEHTFAVHPLIEALIEPAEAMAADLPQVYDFEPGDRWHTYRVEVEGPRIFFLVDDRRVSRAFSSQTTTLSNGPIHILSGLAIIRISEIRILTL